MAAVAYRHWSFRRNIFRPDGLHGAIADSNQFCVNGKAIPNDVVHGVRTFFGFGYVEIYVRGPDGAFLLNEAHDDLASKRIWGRVSLRPR